MFNDSLKGVIKKLSENHHIGVYNNTSTFLDVIAKFNPDGLIFDSMNVTKAEAKFLGSSKLRRLDWTSFSSKYLYLDTSVFTQAEVIPELETDMLAFIQYSPEEFNVVKPFTNTDFAHKRRRLKIFADSPIINEYYCGQLQSRYIASAFASAKSIIVTNRMQKLAAMYLSKLKARLIDSVPELESNMLFLDSDGAKMIEEHFKCK